MFPNRLFIGCAGLVTLVSCSKDPVQYRFSDEQRAWQPYHTGDILRFGHAQDNRVRSYRITNVDDRMEEYGGFRISFSNDRPEYEHITVKSERTDTTFYSISSAPGQPRDSVVFQPTALDMLLYAPEGGTPTLQARCSWDYSFESSLPLDSAIAGVNLNYPNLRILPSVTLGGVTYSQTIWMKPSYGNQQSTRRYKIIRQLYYTRGKGVVAFEEDGTGLWYRLP